MEQQGDDKCGHTQFMLTSSIATSVSTASVSATTTSISATTTAASVPATAAATSGSAFTSIVHADGPAVQGLAVHFLHRILGILWIVELDKAEPTRPACVSV